MYDYLWVGEGVNNADGLREAVKNHPPYVVPCIDMSFAKVGSDDEQYLHAIPYLQFPMLHAGKPFTGERGMIPGVRYASDNDFWMRRCREIWKYHQAHPNGPHVYSGWDAVPPCAETRPTHARWLKRYAPLVEEGTWAWLEIGESSLFAQPLPDQVVASAFVNREAYLVLANYGQPPSRPRNDGRIRSERSTLGYAGQALEPPAPVIADSPPIRLASFSEEHVLRRRPGFGGTILGARVSGVGARVSDSMKERSSWCYTRRSRRYRLGLDLLSAQWKLWDDQIARLELEMRPRTASICARDPRPVAYRMMPAVDEARVCPAMGDRPQAIINKQVLANCDLLVAVFWTRIGSPTGVAVSGTVEEIQEHLNAGKPAMIYFSSAGSAGQRGREAVRGR